MNPTVIRLRKIALWLVVGLVVLLLTVILLTGLALSTAGGSRWVLDQVATQINRLPGQNFSFAGSSGTLTGTLRLHDIRYGNASLNVSIAGLEIDWSPLPLLSSVVSIPALTVTDTVVEMLPEESPSPTSRQPGTPLLEFSPLPVDLVIDRAIFNGLEYRQPGQAIQADSLRFAASLIGQEVQVNGLELDSGLADAGIDLTLTLADFLPLQARLDWQMHQELYAESGPLTGSLTLSGDLVDLNLNHQLTAPFQISSNGRIDTGVSGNPLSLDLTHGSDLLELPPQLTGQALALHELSLLTSGSLDSLRLALAVVVESDLAPQAEVTVNGRWLGQRLEVDDYALTTDTGSLSGSASLNLEDGPAGTLQFQLQEATPLVYVENLLATDNPDGLPLELLDLRTGGELTFAGSGADLQLSVRIDELGGELGGYPLHGGGQVDYRTGGLLVNSFNLGTEDNELSVSGSLAEQFDFNWRLDAPRLDQIMTGLQGRLNASGEVTGTPAALQLSTSLNLAGARFQGLAVDSVQLNLELDEARNLDGRLTLSKAQLAAGEQVNTIESVSFQVAGTETRHRATLAARSSYGDADLAVSGGFTDLASLSWAGQLDESRLETPLGIWSSVAATPVTVTADTVSVDALCWQQNAASVCLDLSLTERGSTPVTQLNGRLNDYPLALFNHPDSVATALTVPPATLPHLPETVIVAGRLDAEFSATLSGAGGPALTARVLPQDVQLTLRSREEFEVPDSEANRAVTQTWLLSEPEVNAALENGRWQLQAGTSLGRRRHGGRAFQTGGSFNTLLSLSEDGALEGTVNASLGDLAWLEAFAAQATGIAGNLTARVDLAGTLQEPRLAMDIRLRDGQATVNPLGVTFTAIDAAVTSRDSNLVELRASVTSDSGNLTLEGQVVEPFTVTRRLQATLAGDQFRLASLPDFSLAVSPDLQVSADGARIDVNGDLRIPTLNVTLRELPEQAVDVSRDVVVVDYPADRPQLASASGTDQSTLFNIPVVADVNILLGDNVSLNGFGFTSTVSGNLNIRQQANGTNLTYGELQIVQGDYRMYGQSLQIRGGKLLFFGPMDNPALDIRATRTVENTTVGVVMNGTLKNISSQLFSTPALPDSDIIAILATGKPFSEIGQGEQDRDAVLGSIARLGLSRSQGLTNSVREQLGLDALAITSTGSINNTTLTVGKYLTPDIFIRYGFGIFDHQSKLALDYILTERITLQAETGASQSVDVIYRVER